MSSAPLPPIPKGKALQWAISKPQEFERYMERVEALCNADFIIDQNGSTIRMPVIFSAKRAMVHLPVLAPQQQTAAVVSSGGDVFGPSNAGLNRIAVFSDTSGKRMKDGGARIADIDPRGRHSLWIPAVAIRPSATGGCAAISSTNSGGSVDINSLDFDPTTAEYAQFAIKFPDTWDLGSITAEFVWAHAAATVNFGVVWSIQALALMDGENIASALSGAILTADTGGATFRSYTSPETSLITPAGTITGEGATIFFRIGRVPTDPADTLAVDAKLIGVRLFYLTNEAQEGAFSEPISYEAEVVNWMSAVTAAGGSLASNSASIANDFMVALNATSYRSKIKYLLPYLGVGIAAARCPLIDDLGAGPATNNNFVDADFSQSTGIVGNGTTKSLALGFKASQLGTSSNGGCGFVMLATGAGHWTLGMNDGTQRFGFGFSTNQSFFWGGSGESATVSAAVTAGHFYGQRASATDRKLYKNGVQTAANTATTPVTSIAVRNLWAYCEAPSGYSSHRCGCSYFTDGTMTAGEIAAFHTLLNSLMLAAGR